MNSMPTSPSSMDISLENTMQSAPKTTMNTAPMQSFQNQNRISPIQNSGRGYFTQQKPYSVMA